MAIDILVHDGNGRLGKNGDGGIYDVELVAPHFVHGDIRLIFPGDENVAEAAFRKRRGRAASAGIEHRHMLVELGHVRLGLRRIAAGLFLCIGPGGEIGPARTA